MSARLLPQLPTFSEYDPGAAGEGSLDPLGLSPLSERLADLIAPGLRARMGNPRFTLLMAVGAYAYQPIVNEISTDGTTTPDIAYEWLVVEALDRSADKNAVRGLPGSQKAKAARRANRRLSARNYLAGPSVFGFNGVYRPYALEARIIDQDKSPGANAEELLTAWERDQGLGGFVTGEPHTPGRELRSSLEAQCHDSLEAGLATAPVGGRLYKTLARTLNPQDMGRGERLVHRNFIMNSSSDVRDEISRHLVELPPVNGLTQPEIVDQLLVVASSQAREILTAVAAYETCATRLDNTFRHMLADAVQRGRPFSSTQSDQSTYLRESAELVKRLTDRAVESTVALNESLGLDAQQQFRDFLDVTTVHELVDALIERHRLTQEAKGKRMWIEPLNAGWTVRRPYWSQDRGLTDDEWIHPTRLRTLSAFVEATQ